jgi:trk system potassium uptake protein TrkA
MRIVVFGAGTVGSSIAELLCQHGHSVTVVDNHLEHTTRINNELDVRVVTGSAAHASVQFQSDVIGADVCLAVTGNDEVNILAASMSKAMGARRAIARVYAPVFRDLSTFDYQRHFNIDRMLSLEHLTASELAREIRNPGSVVVENFARGELEVQEVTVGSKSKTIGKALKDLGLPKNVRIGSIKREDSLWIAGPGDTVEIGDTLTLIGRREDLDEVRKKFRKGDTQKTSVVIAGGGETGYHLAQSLANDHYELLLMEENKDRCEYLAKNLPSVTVVQADATRRSVLEEERVDSADVFVACTGDDENNIMAGVEAREIGTAKILAIVGRPDYATVVGKLGIDRAVSEREVMAKQILGFLNTGPVVSRTELTGGPISVLEIEVEEGTPITEHVLAKIPFPEKTLIAAVMREGQPPSVPGADDRLLPGDTVVALIDNASVDETLLQFMVR